MKTRAEQSRGTGNTRRSRNPHYIKARTMRCISPPKAGAAYLAGQSVLWTAKRFPFARSYRPSFLNQRWTFTQGLP